MPRKPSAASAAPPVPARFEHQLELTPVDGGQRLDIALATALPQYSRSRLSSWIKDGSVSLNGSPARPREMVFGGEKVIVSGTLPPDENVLAESIPLDVAWKDRHLFVINKPAGLVVHPGAGNRTSTMQNALLSLDPALAGLPRSGIVHRIDKETSGLLVVARTLEAHTALTRALKDHDVQREYMALVVRAVTGGGTVNQPMDRHRTDRLRMTVRADGREAITHYRIAERFPEHTLLRVTLETGRTHQIRVHLAHIGHPLVGDPLYGGRRQLTAGASVELRTALQKFKRQALHAAQLKFEHPITGKEVDVSTPLPKDFEALLKVMRRQ